MSGNNSLVSVIIPAYNHEKYVQETIESIINQTYQNLELIIIDDGSKDSTWQKIQEMKQRCEHRFSRVIFETKQNEGTCKTLNRLINLSSGEYIYLIASDDIAKDYAIEKEVEFLSNNKDYALVVGDNEIIDGEGNRCYWDENYNNIYDKSKAKYLTFGDKLKTGRDFDFTSEEFGMYHTLYNGNYIPNGYLIRKSIFEKTGLFTTNAPLEDYWLMLQISKYAKMKYLDEILFSYRWHDNNSIKNCEVALANDKKNREYEEIILRDENKLLKNELLPATICFLKMNKILQNLKFNFAKQNNANLQNYINLLVFKLKVFSSYYCCKLFSKILFGQKRKHYIEKTGIYHVIVRNIRKLYKEKM